MNPCFRLLETSHGKGNIGNCCSPKTLISHPRGCATSLVSNEDHGVDGGAGPISRCD